MINLFAVCKNDRFLRVAARMLENKGINLVDTCTHPDQVINGLLMCRPVPDIILLDANWHTRSYCGDQLLEQLLKVSDPPPKIIMITNIYEETTIKKLKAMGASGYFYRSSGHPDKIFECIKSVHEGENYFQEN